MSISVKIERITPKVAMGFMGHNEVNRPFKRHHCQELTSDMREGRWTHPTLLMVYESGSLADGQHRMQAVINSGKPQDFIVLRGLPKEAALNIDTQAVRSLSDALKIAQRLGVNTGLPADANVHPKMVATARAVVRGDRTTRASAVSHEEGTQMLASHYNACAFAVAHGPSGRFVENAVMRAAIARAWYYEEDKERLAQFGKVVGSGFSQGDDDAAAVAIRNYMQGLGIGIQGVPWREMFLKIQNSIWYFCRRRPLRTIKRVEDERYPLKKGHGK